MSRTFGFDHAFVPRAPCLSVCVAALLVGVPAAAQPPARAVRVGYEAPAACPDGAAFEAQLRARSAKILVSADGKSVVRVRITGHGDRFEGDVALTDAGESETKRHVEGTCPDVVAALSLIAAVALDPMASTASHPEVTPGAAKGAVPGAAPGTKPVAEAAPTPPTPSPPVAPPVPPLAKAAGEDGELPGVSARHAWRWSLGAGGGITEGVGPSLAVSVVGFLDVARWSRDLGAPSFRGRFERSTIDADGSGARFTWTAGSVDACPIALSTEALRVSPCVRAEAGVLDARGESGASKSASRPWVSVGVLARGRLSIVGASFVEIEAGGLVPIVRDRFFLEPDQTVHRAPVVLAAAGANVGVSFW